MLLGLLLLPGAGACARAARATPGPAEPLAAGFEEPGRPEVWDPLESVNRQTFRANLQVTRWVLGPVIRAYALVVPGAARRAVRRALVNLHSPAVFANDVLQLAPVDAGVTLTRFIVNTTVGLVGLFDPATRMGLGGHHTDFGQTMALYGLPSGPYLILPVLGPTTARDGSGYIVDFLFQPTTYILPGLTLFVYTGIHQGSVGLVEFEEQADELRALQVSSVDFYAALRSAYYQDRTAAIADRRDRGRSAIVRLLGAVTFRPSRSEVGDSPLDDRDQALEAVARQD